MAFSNPVAVATATTNDISPKVLNYAGQPGKVYVACLGGYTATDAYTTVTDDGGNTWTRVDYAPKSGSTGRRIEMWVCKPTAPFTKVTAAHNQTGSFYTASLVELTGGSGVVNVKNAIERASSTTPAAVTVTPTKAKTMVLSIIQANSNTIGQITPSSGWTAINSANEGPKIVYKYDPAVSTATGVSWTLTTASGSGHAIAAFEETSSGPWFLWDGTTETPLNLEGTYNGVSIDPCMFDTVVGAPTEPAPSMLVGITSLPENWAGDLAAFPNVKYTRDFGKDNSYGTDADSLPEFTPYGTGKFTNLPADAVMHLSAKDDPALFQNWMDALPTLPAGHPGFWVSPWHEPWDDVRAGTFTTATFRSWGQTITDIVNAHPKKSYIRGVGPILTRWDLVDNNNDPALYAWPGMTFFGVDVYDDKSGGYLDSATLFGLTFDKILAKYPGIPLLVPEFGIVKRSTDATGSGRATAINNHIAYLRSRGDVQAIAYFNEIGSIAGVPLDDTPSADAWRAAQSSQ